MFDLKKESDNWRYKEFKYDRFYFQMTFGVFAIILATLIGFVLFPDDMGYRSNLYTTAVGILITVGFLDLLARRRDELRQLEETKTHLKAKLGSKVPSESLRALEEIKRLGWLYSGELTDAKFPQTSFVGFDFSKSNLDGAYFPHSDLSNCDFLNASVQNSMLFSTSLRNAELSFANFSHSDLRWVDLVGASLIATTLVKAILHDAVMDNANLAMAKLNNVSMQSAQLHYCHLVGTDFTGANMNVCDLTGSRCKDAKFVRTYLIEAKLIGVDFYEADFTGAVFRETEFSIETRLPDGTMWTPETDMRRFTDPNHHNFWNFVVTNPIDYWNSGSWTPLG